MGFRNWNQWQCSINQAAMESVFDAMTLQKYPIWNGSQMSLFDLGFTDAGLDDCMLLFISLGAWRWGVRKEAAAF